MSTKVTIGVEPVAFPENQRLIKDFGTDLVACGKAPVTIKAYVASMRIFQDWLGTDLRSAGRDDFRKYIAHMRGRHLAYSTLRFSMSAISAFYVYLEDEGLIEFNHVPGVMRKYLKSYKSNTQGQIRQYITVEQASVLVNSILPARNKAIAVMLAKTGLRVGELMALDVQDIDIDVLTLSVKPHSKRTNCTVFFDMEAAECLENYLKVRGTAPGPLFQSPWGRLGKTGIEVMISDAAARVGLHNPQSRQLQDRFTPHCFRHCFTTWLDEAGMKREYIQILRGDAGREVIDRYLHSELKKVKESYLAHIPQLGI